MSWSLLFIGTAPNIVKALDEHSTKLDGLSKTEFDSALPHLKGLVEQNSNKTADPVLKLSANGHAYINEGETQYSSCNVTIENLGGTLV